MRDGGGLGMDGSDGDAEKWTDIVTLIHTWYYARPGGLYQIISLIIILAMETFKFSFTG